MHDGNALHPLTLDDLHAIERAGVARLSRLDLHRLTAMARVAIALAEMDRETARQDAEHAPPSESPALDWPRDALDPLGRMGHLELKGTSNFPVNRATLTSTRQE